MPLNNKNDSMNKIFKVTSIIIIGILGYLLIKFIINNPDLFDGDKDDNDSTNTDNTNTDSTNTDSTNTDKMIITSPTFGLWDMHKEFEIHDKYMNSAPTIENCTANFDKLEIGCKSEKDRAGMSWGFKDSDIGKNCKAITDHYYVTATSNKSGNFTFGKKVYGKNNQRIGIYSDSLEPFFKDATISMTVMPRDRQGKNIINRPAKLDITRSRFDNDCERQGIDMHDAITWKDGDKIAVVRQQYTNNDIFHLRMFGCTKDKKQFSFHKLGKYNSRNVIVPEKGYIRGQCEKKMKVANWDRVMEVYQRRGQPNNNQPYIGTFQVSCGPKHGPAHDIFSPGTSGRSYDMTDPCESL